MLQNYLKIAIRNLWKNKLFSFVNIFGLSLSMAIGVILFSRIKENFDTDHFHPKLNQIFRVITNETTEGKKATYANAPIPLASQIKALSFVENTVIIRKGGEVNLQTEKGDMPIQIIFSEPNFFNVFGFKLKNGSAKSLENNPRNVLLSEKTAEKIFGNKNPVGQRIQFENMGSFTVAGIVATPPLASHIHVEAMFSLTASETLEKNGLIKNISGNWTDYKNSYLYTKLKSAENEVQLNAILQKYNRKIDNKKLVFTSQTLESITPWNPAIQNDMFPGINTTGMLTLLALIIALTILAAFNYISLSLARALGRAQEVGIRKTAGATRSQIIAQFLIESTIIAIFALIFTIPLVQILITNIPDINVQLKVDFALVFVLLAYAVVTGLVAGVIPAWMLSAFEPIQILRKLKNLKLFRGQSIYKTLIVIQFSVTIMLMVFFVILADYERKNNSLLQSTLPPDIYTLNMKGQQNISLQNELKNVSQIEAVYSTNWYFGTYKLQNCEVKVGLNIEPISYVSIDPKTIDNVHFKLKAGQNFPENLPENSEQYVLLNEAAAQLFGKNKLNILNKNIQINNATVQVLGIMPNQIIGPKFPIIYRYLPKEIEQLTLKIRPNTDKAASLAIQNIWKKYYPNKTVDLHRLDERFSNSESVDELGFFGFFALLIMIIACMGILGISSYSVEVRTKELGVRKILGANPITLIWTVSKSFSALLLFSGVFGIPAGWYCGLLLKHRMGELVNLGPFNLFIGFVIVSIVGSLTIFSQTYRATKINTAKVLKTE